MRSGARSVTVRGAHCLPGVRNTGNRYPSGAVSGVKLQKPDQTTADRPASRTPRPPPAASRLRAPHRAPTGRPAGRVEAVLIFGHQHRSNAQHDGRAEVTYSAGGIVSPRQADWRRRSRHPSPHRAMAHGDRSPETRRVLASTPSLPATTDVAERMRGSSRSRRVSPNRLIVSTSNPQRHAGED